MKIDVNKFHPGRDVNHFKQINMGLQSQGPKIKVIDTKEQKRVVKQTGVHSYSRH